MEPTAVSSWRNLPSVHPVWKLLYPHTKGILAINTLGRNELIPEGGVADKVLSVGGGGHITLMQKHYRSVTFDSYDLVKNLTERGVKDLPKFYYKDDALLLWEAIRQFVQDIIHIYYKDDKSVKKVNIMINIMSTGNCTKKRLLIGFETLHAHDKIFFTISSETKTEI